MKEKAATDEMLEEAYNVMATIIRDHGEKYLPIFKRLHEEREQRRVNRSLADIALSIAQKQTM